MYSIRVEEAINEPGKIDNNITGIEKHILGGTDEHYFLNKGNKTEGSKNAVSPWWLLLYSQSTMDVIMRK